MALTLGTFFLEVLTVRLPCSLVSFQHPRLDGQHDSMETNGFMHAH